MSENKQEGISSVEGQYAASLAVIAEYWIEFNLEGRRGGLDEVGLKIAEYQETSSQSRRQLAESTKQVRRTQASQIPTEVTNLLKKYQEEIDRLTKRARHSETAYLDIYKALYEAPDPAQVLQEAIQTGSRVTELEASCQKQAQELEEFRAESKFIKNQDVTIRKLEDQVQQLQAELEEQDKTLETAKQQAEQQAISTQLQEAELRIKSLEADVKKQHDERIQTEARLQKSQNQLFNLQARMEEAQAGEESAIEMTLLELDRLQKQVGELENENRGLQKKVEQYGDGTIESLQTRLSASQSETVALKEELAVQRKLCNRYREENEVLERDVKDKDRDWGSRYEALKKALEAQELHSQQLDLELSSRPTLKQVEDLRAQLRTMQTVMGNMNVLEETGVQEGSTVASLEVLLANKNRALEHQVTTQKLELAELRSQLESMSAQYEELKGELQGKTELVKQLEDDLVAAENVGIGSGGGGQQSSEVDGVKGVVIGGGDGEAEGGEGGTDVSMVQVLVSQRERLRKRAQTAEEQLEQMRQQLKEHKNRSQAAHADNVALVERLKFVQGYRKDINSKKVERGGVAEARYEKELEKGLDPFNEFRGKVRESRRQQMAIPDRVLYSVGAIASSNATTRRITFFYGVLVHVLLFVMMMRMAHHSVPSLHQVEMLCQQHHFSGKSGD